MNKTLSLRPFDYVLFLVAASFVTSSLIAFTRMKASAAAATLVINAPNARYAYSLTKDAEVHIEGSLGTSVITITNGTARFISSPCQNKLCIHAGALHTTGDFAACLPNNVIMHIEGASDTQDATSN